MNTTHNLPVSTNNKGLRVDYISDIHADFWIDELNPQNKKFAKQLEHFIQILNPSKGKILLIGGDQGHYFQQDSAVLLELKKYYKNILIVPGNHDMYLLSNAQEKKYQWDSTNRLLEMKQFCREHDGLHFMDGDVIVIDGFRFGGIGMWHDNSYGKTLGYSEDEISQEYYKTMNDSNYIFKDGKKNYNISHGYGNVDKIRHFDPMIRFQEMKEKLSKIEPCHVMLTHYGPIVPEELPEEYDDISTSFYYFDGKSEAEQIAPLYWIFGHTHLKYNFKYKKTNFITNPLGYPTENSYAKIESFYLEK